MGMRGVGSGMQGSPDDGVISIREAGHDGVVHLRRLRRLHTSTVNTGTPSISGMISESAV